MALPNVLVMTAQAGAGLIETWFVGKLGTDALAGVALVFPVLMMMQMMSAGAMGGGIASAIARALGGRRREAAIAGYGTASRLEYLLVPLVFGLGAPLVAMVGACIGAGQRERALRVTWVGAITSGLMCEIIGLAAAFFPHQWLSLFGSDPAMLEPGTRYLQIVGPAYGFFGFGLALYFASQGAGRLAWPLLGNVAAGWRCGGGIVWVFWAQALALYGLIDAMAVAGGAWFGPLGRQRRPGWWTAPAGQA